MANFAGLKWNFFFLSNKQKLGSGTETVLVLKWWGVVCETQILNFKVGMAAVVARL